MELCEHRSSRKFTRDDIPFKDDMEFEAQLRYCKFTREEIPFKDDMELL